MNCDDLPTPGVLGLDPANHCGWCWTDGKSLASGVWLLSHGERARTGEHPGRRIRALVGQIKIAARDRQVSLVAYEDAAFGSHNPRQKTDHAELAGAIRLASYDLGLPCATANPATLKKWLTGSGKADKRQVMAAVERMFGVRCQSDDEADAIMVAQWGLTQRRFSLMEATR